MKATPLTLKKKLALELWRQQNKLAAQEHPLRQLFIGLTATRGMLVSSFVSAVVFFGVYGLTVGLLGNHGLWLAQVIYLAMRGVLQTIWYR